MPLSAFTAASITIEAFSCNLCLWKREREGEREGGREKERERKREREKGRIS
jgi:hypothetical protein